jgi:hypothetical protein
MVRTTTRVLTTLVLFAPIGLYAFQKPAAPAPAADKKPAAAAAPKATDAQKIANAMTGGPAEISKGAAIMDWPDMGMAGAKPKQLRAGTNGWVCYPSTPTAVKGAEDPMCLDKAWQDWADAYMGKTAPKAGMSGIAYMLKGDKGVSNTDPAAMAPSATNQWVVSPPHVMVLMPDAKMLDTYSTDPKNGGPWVMWKGSPYAHLMVPVAPAKAATMSMK